MRLNRSLIAADHVSKPSGHAGRTPGHPKRLQPIWSACMRRERPINNIGLVDSPKDLHRPLKEARSILPRARPCDSVTIGHSGFDCDNTKGALRRFEGAGCHRGFKIDTV
jgi:hypothetical protein